MYLTPPFPTRSGSMRSIPQTTNGQGEVIAVSSMGGALGTLANLWHLSHFFDVFDCVMPECGLVVSFSDDFLGEGLPPDVASAEPLVNLPKYHAAFELNSTPEEWHLEASSIKSVVEHEVS